MRVCGAPVSASCHRPCAGAAGPDAYSSVLKKDRGEEAHQGGHATTGPAFR